jgi:hypothetical protein
MKKYFLFLIFCCISSADLFAQLTLIGEGACMDEPKKGYNNSIIFNDGTICNLSFGADNNIRLNTYDRNMKLVISKNLISKTGRIKLYSNYSNLFESNGKLVLIVNQANARKMEVYRAVIDPLSGEMVKEDKILNDDIDISSAFNALYRGGSSWPIFLASNDLHGSNYAYGFVNTTEDSKDRKLVVKLYNGNHEVINDFTFKWGDKNMHKHIRLEKLVVDGNKVYAFVHALDIGFTLGYKGGSYLMVDCSEKGVHEDFVKIESPVDAEPLVVKMAMNPMDKKLYILLHMNVEKKLLKNAANPFALGNQVFIYDPGTKKIAKGKPVQINEDYQYDMIDDFQMNADGTYTIIYQRVDITDATNHSPGVSAASRINMDIMESLIYTDGDKVTPTICKVDKKHVCKKMLTSSLYNHKLDYDEELAFKGHFFVNGPKNKFVLMNDEAGNEQIVAAGKKPSSVKNLDDCSLYHFNVSGNNLKPDRAYLLNDKESIMMVCSAFYNPTAKIFTALMKDKKSKKVRLVAFNVN